MTRSPSVILQFCLVLRLALAGYATYLLAQHSLGHDVTRMDILAMVGVFAFSFGLQKHFATPLPARGSDQSLGTVGTVYPAE